MGRKKRKRSVLLVAVVAFAFVFFSSIVRIIISNSYPGTNPIIAESLAAAIAAIVLWLLSGGEES